MRWVYTANATAAAQRSVGLVVLCDLAFDAGTLYLCDAFSTVINPANGQSYSGLGDFGGVDEIEESTETVAKAVTLSMSEVPNNLVTDVMATDCQGREVTLWVGLYDVNAGTWVANPEIQWEGRIDYPDIELGESTAKVTLHCENRLNREPLVARYTDQDQQLATSCNFMGYISGTSLYVTDLLTGTIASGEKITGSGVALNTKILSGSSSPYTVNNSQTVGSLGSPVALAGGPPDTFFNLLWMIPNAMAGWGSISAQYPLNNPPGRPPRGGTNGGANGRPNQQ